MRYQQMELHYSQEVYEQWASHLPDPSLNASSQSNYVFKD